jgi:hypothetical protein
MQIPHRISQVTRTFLITVFLLYGAAVAAQDISSETDVRGVLQSFLTGWNERRSERITPLLNSPVELITRQGLRLSGTEIVTQSLVSAAGAITIIPELTSISRISDKIAVAKLRAKQTGSPDSLMEVVLLQNAGKWLISFVGFVGQPSTNLSQPVTGLIPYPLNIPGGTTFSGPIGRLSLCRGQEIIGHTVTIDWGDHETSTGNWTDNAANLIASHHYRGIGQYSVSFYAGATCYYQNGDYQQTSYDDVVGGTIANVYKPVNLTRFTLNPNKVNGGQKSIGIVSVDCPAPSWGAEITITRDNLDEAVMPNSVIIGPGDVAAQFEIRTATRPGVVNITVQIGMSTLKRKLTVR